MRTARRSRGSWVSRGARAGVRISPLPPDAGGRGQQVGAVSRPVASRRLLGPRHTSSRCPRRSPSSRARGHTPGDTARPRGAGARRETAGCPASSSRWSLECKDWRPRWRGQSSRLCRPRQDRPPPGWQATPPPNARSACFGSRWWSSKWCLDSVRPNPSGHRRQNPRWQGW
jgi:hypothetical protein